mmetsp:Transcript_12705/g.10860  ORF Transcript_12705/g.10860 Transcript_12705/m.10860 type:complete len:251 (-) Transcript_12705:135-887(-)
MNKFIILSLLAFTITNAQLFTQFDYLQQGLDWTEYANCDYDTYNYWSPIDLNISKATAPMDFYYFFTQYSQTTATLTEYNITVELNGTFGYTYTENAHYTRGTFGASSVRFHSQSEHTFNGNHYPIEVQVYHELWNSSTPANQAGNNLFVSVFFNNATADSEASPFLQTVIDAINNKSSTVDINLNDILPKEAARFPAFMYQGTQTIPTCQDAVWTLMINPFSASADQVQFFHDLYNGGDFQGNGNNRAT